MNAAEADLQRRLRGDRSSVLAASATVAAGIPALVSAIDLVPASFQENRASILYWAVLLAFAWWASSVITFGPRWLGTIRPAIIFWPAVSCASVAYVLATGGDALLPCLALAVSIIFAAIAWVLLNRSVLGKHIEGN